MFLRHYSYMANKFPTMAEIKKERVTNLKTVRISSHVTRWFFILLSWCEYYENPVMFPPRIVDYGKKQIRREYAIALKLTKWGYLERHPQPPHNLFRITEKGEELLNEFRSAIAHIVNNQ